jgi:hypothetical protein
VEGDLDAGDKIDWDSTQRGRLEFPPTGDRVDSRFVQAMAQAQ